MPYLSTVQWEAAKRFSPPSEGAYNAPRIVSTSEDATEVLTCIDYDSNSNKLCYLLIQPICGSFQATLLDNIEQMFLSTSKASSAYIYMVRPRTPPFCLCIIGTGNCFDARSFTNRWKYMIKECKKRNIENSEFWCWWRFQATDIHVCWAKTIWLLLKKCKYVELVISNKEP